MVNPSDKQLNTLTLASPFAYGHWQSHREQILAVFEKAGVAFSLEYHLNKADIDNILIAHTAHLDDETAIMSALRQVRHALMVFWIWQDALGLLSVQEITNNLSQFANQAIIIAKDFVYQNLTKRYGEPYVDGKVPKKDELAIIAMGKLGAGELNLSSDIDLIFVHQGTGETNGKKSIDNQKFMTHLGRGIIRLLDEITADGFVFRVDMRLRPWGDGSPLVMTLPALIKYFDVHGRTWERFAWLKARVVNAIDGKFLDGLLQARKNFVFRYYVDYSTFSALREMRQLISNQVAQRQDLDNVKLGVGGIRDIEFIAQSFALIYGGKYPSLVSDTACVSALAKLANLQLLPQKTCDELTDAYLFLRRLEHAIQARHDTQTQKLPQGDELTAIALTLGFADETALLHTLNEHRTKVSQPFDELVAKREYLNKQSPTVNHQADLEQLSRLLNDENTAKLTQFWQSKLIATATPTAKERLENAYPILIHALLAEHESSGTINKALPRLLSLLEAIVKRSIYLVMLSENPKDTMNLMPLLAKSGYIAGELCAYPVLLDTLLQKHYQHLPDRAELSKILAQNLLSVADFDDENFLMSIRLFKKNQVLAVAECDILNHHPLMKVSDSLTFIGEVVLNACLMRAFYELTIKHGYPCGADGVALTADACGVAIVGYGKLGGIEMGYASDLDVVFLHRLADDVMTVPMHDTHECKPISGMKFATRLVQKLITYLTTQTRDGRAYELDMRLRPSGNAGVMVVSVNAFANYQADKAWAWEHQALVRARGICGDGQVLAQFDAIRQAILTTPRDRASVKAEVLAMRQKMYEHFVQTRTLAPDEFHLKYSYGGLIDIEFIAQYLVLAFAGEHNELAVWSDNVRIFECVAQAGVLDNAICQTLTELYLKIRKACHLKSLDNQSRIDKADNWDETRKQVGQIWQSVFEMG